jgi:hypothetical protein
MKPRVIDLCLIAGTKTPHLPKVRIKPVGELVWFVDKAAAS